MFACWGRHLGEEVPPSYPSSSKRATNWDRLAREMTEPEPGQSADGEGGDALNALFQQIYADADDDTRRAMIKSFTESGGTSLSTNWDEVGQKRVEVVPPKGMEQRKY